MKHRTFLSLLLGLTAVSMAACASAQDASKAYSRAAINRGGIVPAESIRVHEYLNYYDQRFPDPLGETLGLDLRLGNPEIPVSGGPAWLQIGLQARVAERTERSPLNLALVLDTSGSMDEPDKMPYLKQSLAVFLATLRPEDRVAIVTYSNDAHLIWPSQPMGDGAWIRNTVDSLRAGGNTNLHAGLMLGLEEVAQNFDIRRNNRVILLTDGIANRGVTDSDRIAREALEYNQDGIYLSTIGLGLNFNDQLLSTLAHEGRGAYHFVDSAQEMDKVFRQEVEGLLERVANDVRISIEPMAGVELQMVTGVQGSPPSHGAQVVMQDMGAGDSQVMIVRLYASAGAQKHRGLATVTLSYFDVFGQRVAETTQMVFAEATEMSRYEPLADIEVLRNATIVRSAETLIAIDDLFERGLYESAFYMAQAMEQDLRTSAALTGDRQMVEDADLFSRYQVTLANALGYNPAPQPQAPSNSQPQRWGTTVVSPLPTLSFDD